MRRLLLSTAISGVAGFGAIAQTAGGGDATMAQPQAQQSTTVPALRMTDVLGTNLYTHDSDAVRNLHGASAGQPGTGAQAERWTSHDTFLAERDQWESIGSIDDVVVTGDGQVRGVLVDVGGFLGFGARQVMVDLDQLYFVTDTEQAQAGEDFFVVAAISRDRLEELAEQDEGAWQAGFQLQGLGTGRHGAPAAAEDDTGMIGSPRGPALPPQGYGATEMPTSVDGLIGAAVIDAHGDMVGEVEDLVVGDNNTVTHVVLDIGGYIGRESQSVRLELTDPDFYYNAETDSLRVHLPMTEAQLESLFEVEMRPEP